MNSISHDLFLLMLNLSQFQKRERIIQVFIDAMNSMQNEVVLSIADDSETAQENILPIQTSRYKFENIQIEGDFLKLSKEMQDLIRNSVQMLAVILENKKQEKLLSDEKLRLKEAIRERTEELHISEARLKEAQKLAGLGLWHWDVKTGDVIWSEEVYKIFHLNPEEFTPQIDSILKLSPWPEHNKRDQELIQKAIESREKGEYEQKFLFPDGSIGYYHSTFQGKYDDEGNLVSIEGTVLGVTKQKQAEEKLRANESLLTEIARNYPNSYISIIEKDLTIGFTSGQEFTKQNLDPNQFIGLSLEQVFGDNITIVRQYYEKTFLGEEQSFELFMNNQNQCYRTVPLYSTDGSINRILSVVENITERKKAETALRQSEENLRITLNSIGDAMIATDINGKVVRMNPVAEKLTGWKFENAKNKKISKIFNIVNNKTRKIVDNPVEKVLKSGKTVGLANHTMLIARDGKEYQIADSGAPIIDEEGNTTGVVLVFRDVTEAYKAREAIKENEKKFRSLFNNINVGVALHEIITDKNNKPIDFVFLDANPTYEKLTKLKISEIIGKRGTEVIPILEQKWIDAYGKVAQTGEPITFIDHSEYLDRYWEVRAYSPQKNQFAVALTDITDRKKAETALQESERILNATGKLAKIGGWEHDLLSGKAIWTEALYDIIEIPYDQEPPGVYEHTSYYPEMDQKILEKYYNDAIENGTPFDLELRVYTDKKKLIWCRAQGEPIFKDGKCTKLRGTFQDITDRKLAEMAMHQEKDKAQQYLDVAGVMFIALDSKGIITLANKKASEILGDEPNIIIGKKWFENYVPDRMREQVRTVFNSLMNGKIEPTEYYENSIVNKNGDERLIAWHNALLIDDDGKIIGTLSSGEDITEHKLAEKALQKSERRYRELFEHSRDGFVIFDPTGNFIDANQAFCEMLGYSLTELKGKKDFYEITPLKWRDWEKNEIWEKRLLKGGYSDIYEKEYIHKDGTVFPIEFQSYTVLDDDGEILYLWGIVRNITERKRAEEELRQRESLLNSTQRLSKIGGWLWDIEKENMYWTDETYRIHGIDPGKINHGSQHHIDLSSECYYENDRPIILEAFYKCAKDGIPYDMEFPFRSVNGEKKWIRTTAEAQKVENKIVKVLGTIMDITERKRVEEALEKRIVALTRPLDDTKNLIFEELFNIEDIQRLQDDFSNATGVASIITHTDGTPITRPSNFCQLCSDIIRQTEKGRINCYKSDAELGRYYSNGPIIQPCMSGGLWDAGTSISIGGKHVANWLIGQVRDETQTEENMRDYAKEIGADEETVIKAFYEVPSMSHEQFELVAKVLFTIANMLSTTAFQNVQQARFITELKRVEDEIRESAKRLISSQHIAKMGDFTWDVQTGEVTWSDALFDLLQYNKSEIINYNKVNAEIHHPDDQERVTKWLNDCISSGNPELTPNEYRVIRKDGKVLHIRTVGVIQRKQDNSVKIFATVQDISESKQAEKQIKHTLNMLYDSQEAANVGTWWIDLSDKILHWTPQVFCIFEIEPSQYAPTLEEFFHYIHQEDVELIRQKTEEQFTNFYGPTTIVYRIKLTNGKIKYIEHICRQIRNENGQITRVFGTIQDITEKKQAEANIQKMNEELEQRVIERTHELAAANEELKNFAYVVSHDLKAPLRAVSQIAHWLAVDYQKLLDVKGQDLIDLLLGRVKRMDNLINGILQYSRVGRVRDKDVILDLNLIVKDVIQAIGPPENISIKIENQLPIIYRERIRIEQIFQNLFSNSIKFMDKSKGEISVSSEDLGSHWKFKVKDNGPGIDSKYFDKIFKIFQTLKPRDELESTGIGLTIIKKIIEIYEGKIWVESQIGKGTTFHFTLKKNLTQVGS